VAPPKKTAPGKGSPTTEKLLEWITEGIESAGSGTEAASGGGKWFSGQAKDNPKLVMELLGKLKLESGAAAGAMTPEELAKIVKGLAD